MFFHSEATIYRDLRAPEKFWHVYMQRVFYRTRFLAKEWNDWKKQIFASYFPNTTLTQKPQKSSSKKKKNNEPLEPTIQSKSYPKSLFTTALIIVIIRQHSINLHV